MIVVGGWPDRVVVGLNGRFGVRPADFATGGDFDCPFLDDVDPGDETTEFVAVVQSLPGSGTVVFDDDGGFEHTGAADGTYTTSFTLCTWAQGGPVTEHTPDEEITTTFGDVDTAPGVTLVAAASLLPGSASGSANATAAGVTLTATASLLAGAASGSSNATAAGAVLQAAASLLAGGASADGHATAPGQLLTLSLALIPGSASGVAPVTPAARHFSVWVESRHLSIFEGQTMTTARGMAPGAELDWTFGWDDPPPKGPWLQDGETISSRTITVDAPLEFMSSTEAGGTVTVWVRMPAGTAPGTVGAITCAIVTSAGRKTSRRRELVATVQ